MALAIHWFRRDLRLHDNPALQMALHASAGQVIPLFILDPAILKAADTGRARVAFLLDSLQALDQALQGYRSRLIIRMGSSLEQLQAVQQQSGAATVTWNRDYTPFAQRRDNQAEAILKAQGVDVIIASDAVICEPDQIRTAQGGIYTVFTPYRRTWWASIQNSGILQPPPPQAPFQPMPIEIDSLPIPRPEALGFSIDQQIPVGGEAAGLAQLASFGRLPHGAIGNYSSGRNLLAEAGTSRLSAYLRFGCVAPRTALRHAAEALAKATNPTEQQGAETWISELAWRDFYYQIMANFPYVLKGAFKRQYDQIQWQQNEALLQAWREGKTGYPIVDAAMRQLNQEAWMHNRARMIVASFLTKDLLIDWRHGERYFMQQLVDGDHASNNGGWQWAAGTGTDAQPYFRIFNPVSQGQTFDPEGAYVRRYLPELARVPTKYIHAPWSMTIAEQRSIGVRIGHDYPAPIVEHATQRLRALEIYKAARAN